MGAKKKNELDVPVYLFHQGSNGRSYEFLGAHITKVGRVSGVVFRVWAPNAAAVAVCGGWNDWNACADPMEKVSDGGVWERFVPNIGAGELYKFAVTTKKGSVLLKADPYAFHNETRPATASIVYSPEYTWNDGAWMAARRETDMRARPLNIYEVHLGAWRRYPDGSFFDYRKTAEELSEYVLNMGYTHIELMPVTEYPFDGSWGYQCLGYFAPTSRYGAPEDFMYFVDLMHQKGIGVIMDWVPAHFPKDSYGLADFDGAPCYEYKNPLMGERPEWGTKVFDFGRSEVRCFLISSAMYWLEQYHIDGIRADAVSSMLYRDYGRQGQNWERNRFGGRENLEAVSLLRSLNAAVAESYPGVMMIAEESTAWPEVTKSGGRGLGFTFKWNMGWMNDTLSYMSLDPVFRAYNHDKLTFGLVYAFSESYILPLSHDEVVHGKKSLINKLPGNYEEKFDGIKTLFAYMTCYPGKKLLFMGQEFGQFIEWDEDREIDWLLLQYEKHEKLQKFVRVLNRLYLTRKELWNEPEGWNNFAWASCDEAGRNAVALRRMASSGELLCFFSFCPNPNPNFTVGVPEGSRWQLILSSDDKQFGGEGAALPAALTAKPLSTAAAEAYAKAPAANAAEPGTAAVAAEATAANFAPVPQEICGQPAAVSIDLPPRCAVIYKRIYR